MRKIIVSLEVPIFLICD